MVFEGRVVILPMGQGLNSTNPTNYRSPQSINTERVVLKMEHRPEHEHEEQNQRQPQRQPDQRQPQPQREHQRQRQGQRQGQRQRQGQGQGQHHHQPHRSEWWLSRTPHCKHRGPCLLSILKSTPKIALITYLIKAGLSILFSLKKIFKAPSQLFTLLLGKDAIRFGLFVGSFVGLFRSILCSMRRVVDQQRQKYIPLLAGLVGGLLSVLFLAKQTRQSIGLFLMARAIDITYQSLVKKGYLPQFKYFYVVLYALMMGISGYAYGTEPGSMSPQMNKFYLTFTNETLSDMQMRQIWIERKNNYLARYGIPRQDPLDYMPKLKKYYQGLEGGAVKPAVKGGKGK